MPSSSLDDPRPVSRRHRSGGTIIGMPKVLAAALILLGAAFALNPGADAHREKLKSEIAARNQLAGALRIGNLAALASTYHSLGIASYSTIHDRKITLGAFGIVYVPDLAGP